MFYWIYDYPTSYLAIGITVLFVGISWVGSLIVRPFLRLFVRTRYATNDIVGYVLSSFGVFYGLLLGLISIAAYQNYSTASNNVALEAASLSALHEDVSMYREPYRQNLRWLLRDYTRYLIKEAWPKYQIGQIPAGSAKRIKAFQERLLMFEPTTKSEEIVHAEAIRQFNTFLAQQQNREYGVLTGIPAVMWYVVIVGSLLNILIVWFFDMDFLSHLILGGILSFFLGTVILLIAALDNPFRGEVSISPDPFEQLYWERMRD